MITESGYSYLDKPYAKVGGRVPDARRITSSRDESRRVDLLRDGLGSMAAGSITPQIIARWRAKASKENSWTPATANLYKALISLAFRLGVENGKCSSNPARAVRRLREDNERVRHLSQEEENRLREAIAELCPERAADLDVALNTGLRQAEQYTLTWRDVNLHATAASPSGRQRTALAGIFR